MLPRRRVVDQAAHRLGQRIVVLRHAVGRETHLGRRLLALGIGLGLDDARRVADRGRPSRHRLGHHRVAADLGAVADV